MQRLPEETGNPGDCVQCGGRTGLDNSLSTEHIILQDPDDAGDNVDPGLDTEGSKREIKDSLDMREDVIIRGESETTEYDLSTDDESLR